MSPEEILRAIATHRIIVIPTQHGDWMAATPDDLWQSENEGFACDDHWVDDSFGKSANGATIEAAVSALLAKINAPTA